MTVWTAVSDLQFGWWESLFDTPPTPKTVVSLVGAGGKTSLMFTLGKELSRKGYRVGVTTTTHIQHPTKEQSPGVVTDGDFPHMKRALDQDGLVTVGIPSEYGKLGHPGEEVLHWLRQSTDFLLIEADGSKRLPIKFIREGEPVLFSQTDLVVALCGMSCIGNPIGTVCHRPQLACQVLDTQENHVLKAADVAKLLFRAYGLCWPQVVFTLNQADSPKAQEEASVVAQHLLDLGASRVVGLSIKQGMTACWTCDNP